MTHCACAHALFASLQLDWATTACILHGPTNCLPHEDGGVLLSVLPTCSPYYPFRAKHQAGELWLPFFDVFLDKGNEPQVYGLQRGR